MKLLKRILLGSLSVLLLIVLLVYFSAMRPSPVETADVSCPASAPTLKAGTSIKVLNWNVQYMAGKNYTFFYDTPKGDGPDIRPDSSDIGQTIQEVARVIKSENPDVILLQEVDDGSDRTDDENQLDRLLPLLSSDYKCFAEAFYWKAMFVPHPKIMGSVGMKVVTISKYKITDATRHQLSLIPADPISSHLGLKRCILAATMPVSDGTSVVALNTHLDAFAQGYDTMERQVNEVDTLLTELNSKKVRWFIGGDFNLLPPTINPDELGENKIFYNPKTEVTILFDKYKSVFTAKDLTGPGRQQFFTHYPNDLDPNTNQPDRTIDYIFFEGLSLKSANVRKHDTLKISDHLPIHAEFTIQ